MSTAAAWILVAHGSRLEAANDEVRSLAARLSALGSQTVRAAFLEIAQPSIPEAIEQAARTAPSEILILPYFLTQGRHVQEDIPAVLAAKAKAFPETPIRLLPYFGTAEAILEVLAGMAEKG